MAASAQRPKISRPASAIYLGSSESPKLSSGFASVQVGLGSPRFDFGKRNGTVSPDKMLPSPGLPSPPITESDIGPPPLSRSTSSSKSSTPAATASASRIPRASPGIPAGPVLQRTPSLARTSSISSTASSSRKIRPKTSPSLSASQSSTASSKLSALKPRSAEQRALINGQQVASSPTKASPQRSPAPASPAERTTRRISKRMSGSWESGLADEAIEEEAERPGLDLDERIRKAEEKIRHTNHRRISVEQVSSPANGVLRRHYSYTRTAGAVAASSPSINNQATLRRSATLTSASVWADTPNKTPDVEAKLDEHQRDRSGGSSGSSKRKPLPTEFRTNTNLFTPSPKASTSSDMPSHQASSSRSSRLSRSPEDIVNASPAPSRFSSERRSRETTTEAPQRYRHSMAPDVVGRAASLRNQQPEVSGYTRRQWSESISGLPQVDKLDQRGLPSPRDRGADRIRAESAMAITPDRTRYASTLQPLSARHSRTPLRPQDSVSAVGARSEHTNTPPSTSKDPLDVIRRMEEQRNQHNRQWEQDRAASVIGEVSQYSPRRVDAAFPRPATSMSSLRDRVPATEPLDRVRHWSPDINSPTTRTFSRTAQVAATEPRLLRASTSAGRRPGTSLSIDPSAPLAEHCRLLFEAFRALELKLSPELLAAQPELLRSFLSSTKNLENMNTSLRSTATFVTDLCVQLELEENPHRGDFNRLADMIRDNAKSSDQAVRDLTRIMLDLPKLLRESSRAPGAPDSMRVRRTTSISSHLSSDPVKPDRWARSPDLHVNGYADSPFSSRPYRHSTEMLRPVTSIGDTDSPSRYRNAPFGAGSSRGQSMRDRPSTMSSFLSKVRGSLPPRSTISDPALDPIEASPPSAPSSRMPSATLPKDSDGGRNRALRKKASSASTNTVRGSSFMPASSRVKTTTAVSTINAGTGEESPPSKAMQAWVPDEGEESDHGSFRRSSVYRRRDGNRRSEETDRSVGEQRFGRRQTERSIPEREIRLESDDEFSGGSYGHDADPIADLEQRLAEAAREREERASMDGHSEVDHAVERKKSIAERFRDTLRVGSGSGGRVV